MPRLTSAVDGVSSSTCANYRSKKFVSFCDAIVRTVCLLTMTFVDSATSNTIAESTCTNEQIATCRNAASSGQFSSLSAAGTCVAKSYVHYTHICTVNEYVPGAVDYCCCHVANPERLFCCRYHQDWYNFRCREAADDISYRLTSERYRSDVITPTHVVVPIVACLLTAIIVAAVCYVRYRRHDDRCLSNSTAGQYHVTDSTARPDCVENDVVRSGHDKPSGRLNLMNSSSLSPIEPTAPPLHFDSWSSRVAMVTGNAMLVDQVPPRYVIHPPPPCNRCGRTVSGTGREDYNNINLQRHYNDVIDDEDDLGYWRTCPTHSQSACRMTSLPPPYTD